MQAASTSRVEPGPSLKAKPAPLLRPVHVFVPYQLADGRAVSPYYDTDEFRAELPGWFDASRHWEWRAITLDPCSLRSAVDSAVAEAAIVLNLCDGDEQDGYPGPTVVAGLAASGVPYSGADPAFYAVSSSKLAMKKHFVAAGVATAPFQILDHESAVERVGDTVGFPCILKLDISADGIGMTRHSVVGSSAELRTALAAVGEGGYLTRRPFVEQFVAGREMSVLVVGDHRVPDQLCTFPPVECVFDERIPVRERILFKGHRSFDPFGDRLAEGAPARVDYRIAPEHLHAKLAGVAALAYNSVGGVGYARVDLRVQDSDGAVFVLEVNANCSLSRDELSIAPALAAVGCDFSRFVSMILGEASGVSP